MSNTVQDTALISCCGTRKAGTYTLPMPSPQLSVVEEEKRAQISNHAEHYTDQCSVVAASRSPQLNAMLPSQLRATVRAQWVLYPTMLNTMLWTKFLGVTLAMQAIHPTVLSMTCLDGLLCYRKGNADTQLYCEGCCGIGTL